MDHGYRDQGQNEVEGSIVRGGRRIFAGLRLICREVFMLRFVEEEELQERLIDFGLPFKSISFSTTNTIKFGRPQPLL